jgi:hypothetical protein
MGTGSLYSLFTDSVNEKTRRLHGKVELIDNALQQSMSRIWHRACLRMRDEPVYPARGV